MSFSVSESFIYDVYTHTHTHIYIYTQRQKCMYNILSLLRHITIHIELEMKRKRTKGWMNE